MKSDNDSMARGQSPWCTLKPFSGPCVAHSDFGQSLRGSRCSKTPGAALGAAPMRTSLERHSVQRKNGRDYILTEVRCGASTCVREALCRAMPSIEHEAAFDAAETVC